MRVCLILLYGYKFKPAREVTMKADKHGTNTIIICPNQLIVRSDRNPLYSYIYANVYEIIGGSEEAYSTFLNISRELGIFKSISNANVLQSYAEGSYDIRSFKLLCNMCKLLQNKDIDVRFKFDKSQLIESGIKKADERCDNIELFPKSEAKKIADSYIWYFKNFVELNKIKTISKTNGKPTYNIETIQDKFAFRR